ncbi:MAG: molybdopterin-dependent oxidoreductase [Pseudomonadota bacterium]
MADGAPIESVKTTCPYCGVGCGVKATPTGRDSAIIAGDTQHPANWGKLCSKGSALGETLGQKGRLLAPMVDGQRTSWNAAMARVAEGFQRAIDDHGPDSVAFYLSGQLLTEDYYVANKLMKGFIGSANVDTNSRLCMASAVAGHKRAFGTDTIPCTYDDLELCDLLVLTGSNLAWCHPVIYQRIVAEKERRPNLKVVVIDPRRTPTCDIADLHLALAPSSDVALYLGLFHHLIEHGVIDHTFVAEHTNGIGGVTKLASSYTIAEVAKQTRLSEEQLAAFFNLFAQTERTVTLFSMGTNQAADGTDRVNAIINAHLLTGRLGREGMGPFSMTGQPNAMGGREVGGLASQLACHMDFDPVSIDRVQRFWNAPAMAHAPGLKAVDLFQAVEDGRIKAIWIMATNPVVSMPDADRVKAALKACPLVVVSDIVPDTDTARCADVLLPATGWGEKDGTVTNSERRMSRQRAFLPPPGLTRHDWAAVCDLAKRLGHGDAFNFKSPAEIFREYAAMTAFENNGSRDLDLGGLMDMSDADYAAIAPVQWPQPECGEVKARFFADGQFYTEDRKARFVAPTVADTPTETTSLTLNTGRIRDQWHTMTRTRRAPRLNRHAPEPFVEVHPDDAERFGLAHDSLSCISNDRGSIIVRTIVTDAQDQGSIFVPMHWTGETASAARVDAMVAPIVDPISGQPALKSSSVRIVPFEPAWHGFAVGMALEHPDTEYWAEVPCERGHRMELAGLSAPDDWSRFAKTLLNAGRDAVLVHETAEDEASYRCAVFERGRMTGIFLASDEPVTAARDWLAEQIGRVIPAGDRHRILSGQPPEGVFDPGPTVCACLGVGRNTICRAIKNGANNLNAVGERTGAGTGCGSCRQDIRKLMEVTRVPEKA